MSSWPAYHTLSSFSALGRHSEPSSVLSSNLNQPESFRVPDSYWTATKQNKKVLWCILLRSNPQVVNKGRCRSLMPIQRKVVADSRELNEAGHMHECPLGMVTPCTEDVRWASGQPFIRNACSQVFLLMVVTTTVPKMCYRHWLKMNFAEYLK